jgi:hypothetical protein
MAYWWMIAIDAVSSVSVVSSGNILLLSKYKVKFLFKVNETRTNRDNMHSVQVYVIRFVNDLVLRFPLPMKMTNMIKLKYFP